MLLTCLLQDLQIVTNDSESRKLHMVLGSYNMRSPRFRTEFSNQITK